MKNRFKSNGLLPLKEYGKLGSRDLFYPIILDKDPEFAADFLTVTDAQLILPTLKEIMDNIVDNDEYPRTPIYNTITYSSFNYAWFCTFINRLSILVNHEELKYPLISSSFPNKRSELVIYPPFHKGSNCPVTDKFRVATTDPVDLYRITYIRKDVELEDFRDGFPAWYLMTTSTVFEQYNEVTNTRVRIDFRNGEFIYYISGASDNWKQIQDIPIEMDHVVSALLFRN